MSSHNPNPNQSKHEALSDYQKAVLQAMGIPLFDLNAGQTSSDEDIAPQVSSTPATRSEAQAPIESKPVQLIEEKDTLVQQVLNVFAVSQTSDLGIQWQIHETDSIAIKDNVLLTPSATTLRSPQLKKQLWETLQPYFDGQQWS